MMRSHLFFVWLLAGAVLISIGACVTEPKEKISDRLFQLPSEDAKILLRSKVDSLSKWHAQMSNLRDSDNEYLFRNVLVRDLYKNPHAHFQLTMELLNDPKVNDEVKLFLVRLSQCLSVDEYLRLGEVVLNSVVAGHSGEEVLRTLVSPGEEWGTVVALNYESKNVEAFLRRIQRHKALRDKFTVIDGILNGTKAAFIRSYVKAGEHFSMLICENQQ